MSKKCNYCVVQQIKANHKTYRMKVYISKTYGEIFPDGVDVYVAKYGDSKLKLITWLEDLPKKCECKK